MPQTVRAAGAGLALLCAACVSPSLTDAGENAALEFSAADTPATYVLAEIDGQRSSPFVLFDHTCGATRWTVATTDTLQLWPDGAYRRSSVLERRANGAMESTSLTVNSGRWQWIGAADPGYVKSSPTISIASSTDIGRTVSGYRIRVRDARSLVMNAGVGGSCPGSANDGREATFVFTRVP